MFARAHTDFRSQAERDDDEAGRRSGTTKRDDEAGRRSGTTKRDDEHQPTN